MTCTASAYVTYLNTCATNMEDIEGPGGLGPDLNDTANILLINKCKTQCHSDLVLKNEESAYKKKQLTLRVLSSLEDWLKKCRDHFKVGKCL